MAAYEHKSLKKKIHKMPREIDLDDSNASVSDIQA